MISDKTVVSDRGNECEGIDAALAVIEKTARFEGFGDAEVGVLRTLAEEMVVGSAAILGVFSGTMWAETEGCDFRVILRMEGLFNQTERDRLVELTRENRNTLPKGFFAKLGVLIGNALTGEYYYPFEAAGEPNSPALLWESEEIAEMMREADKETPEEKTAREEAKRLLDTLADDVKVSARAGSVEIVATKRMPDCDKNS